MISLLCLLFLFVMVVLFIEWSIVECTKFYQTRTSSYAHVQAETSEMSANVALELASTTQPQTAMEHVDMDIDLSPIEEEDD